MNRLLGALVLFTLCLPAAVRAQDAAPATDSQTYLSQLPPLLDRALFFGDPEISGAQISPDGQHISFRKPYRDVMNIWVKGTDEPFDAARPLTADTSRPVTGYFWSEDSEYVLYVQDKGGNENYHVYAVDPSAEAEEATGVPPARNLTPMEGVRAQIIAVPEATPGEIVVGLNERDPRWHDVYRVDLASGERELLIENDSEIAFWQTDLDGTVHLAGRTTADGGTEILRVIGGALGGVVYTCSVEETCYPLRFHKDGERVYMMTNKGEDVNFTRLVLFNPETEEMELVESDPEAQVDFGGAVFSDATEELVATYYVGDRLRYYPKSESFAEDLAFLQEELPEGEIYFGPSTEDETQVLVSVTRDVDPGARYLYNRDTGTVELLYRSRPELPSEHLAQMQAIRYTARDGLEIPAYLTVPQGVEAEDLPAVILPHGGPWSRDTWGYDAFAQFLANRGYVVLQPNFRGSTGYGKAFLNAGNEGWGTGAMQHDLTDGVQYLVEEGLADPERVSIFGISYGGYATLAGLAFTPELYAAGVSYVGPSNLLTLLNSIPPYWASIKHVFDVRVGDPNDPEDRERLRAQSPLFSADQIEAPLMVIQGANDPRVKQQESDQIVVALHERGFPVEYLVAEDEGHGFAGRENRLAVAAAMERFLAEHLGGRYQEEVPPNIEATLEDLAVDPATVELPDSLALAQAEAAQTAPLPGADGTIVEPATMQYQGTLRMQGQEIAMDMTRTIAASEVDGEAAWRIVDATEMPMGTATDTFYVARQTLRPLHRSAGGMGGTVTLDYSDEAITGRMGMGGQTMDINTALDAPVLGDGPGMEIFLAGLPLEPGYEATLRTFNTPTQSVQAMRLEVTGTASTEVPAGTYETLAVQLTPVDENGSAVTLFVTQEAPHYVVRGEYALPAQMGGGTMTTELTSMQRGDAGDAAR